jgi:hypothetical protein
VQEDLGLRAAFDVLSEGAGAAGAAGTTPAQVWSEVVLHETARVLRDAATFQTSGQGQ